jgi:hypothetical protein
MVVYITILASTVRCGLCIDVKEAFEMLRHTYGEIHMPYHLKCFFDILYMRGPQRTVLAEMMMMHTAKFDQVSFFCACIFQSSLEDKKHCIMDGIEISSTTFQLRKVSCSCLCVRLFLISSAWKIGLGNYDAAVANFQKKRSRCCDRHVYGENSKNGKFLALVLMNNLGEVQVILGNYCTMRPSRFSKMHTRHVAACVCGENAKNMNSA